MNYHVPRPAQAFPRAPLTLDNLLPTCTEIGAAWGRFWGGEPKENGALLIVLWQLMMVHMRLSGLAKPDKFALGMVLNNIVVIMAWFGVNLLSIGLHSYGFASGIAVNIILFTVFELVTGFGTYYWARSRKKLAV